MGGEPRPRASSIRSGPLRWTCGNTADQEAIVWSLCTNRVQLSSDWKETIWNTLRSKLLYAVYRRHLKHKIIYIYVLYIIDSIYIAANQSINLFSVCILILYNKVIFILSTLPLWSFWLFEECLALCNCKVHTYKIYNKYYWSTCCSII